jgi:hypothetical protein
LLVLVFAFSLYALGGHSLQYTLAPPLDLDNIHALRETGDFLTRHSRNQTGKSVTMPEWASNS